MEKALGNSESGKRKAEIQSEAGFCFSAGAARGFRGWLFLARLSEALQICEMVDTEHDGEQSSFAKRQATEDRSGVLASKIIRKQNPRPVGESNLAPGRLARFADLGVRVKKEPAELPAANPAGFDVAFGLWPSSNPERIAIIQPKVARNELPWVIVEAHSPTLKELHQSQTYRSSNSTS
jgi:hypothetical protein